MVDELKRNGSGYYDPTAYKAMKNFEIGGVTTMKRGEIWKIGFGRDENGISLHQTMATLFLQRRFDFP